jgi:lipoate-protein ligase A
VLLGIDEPRVRTLFPTTRDPLATLTTLETALGHRPSFDEVAAALGEAFEQEHGLALRPGGLSEDEISRVTTLVTDRYASPDWLATPA